MKSFGVRNGVRPTITTAEEGTIALVAGDKGAIFYNTDTDSLRTWDGTAFQDVGASGGTKDFVATGTIGDGQAVGLRSDGTVEIIEETLAVRGWKTATNFTAGAIADPLVVYDTANEKVVVVYRDVVAANVGRVLIGTVTAGVITFGTPITYTGTASVEVATAIYDTISGNIVILWGNQTALHGWKCTLGAINGSSMDFFTTASLTDTIGVMEPPKLLSDPSTGKIVAFYNNNINDGNDCAIGTIAGLSISFGTGFTVNNISSNTYRKDMQAVLYDPINDKVIVVYRDSSRDGQTRILTGSIIGDSITWGTEKQWETRNPYISALVFDVSIGKPILIWYNDLLNITYASVCTLSGTTISVASETSIDGAASNDLDSMTAVYDPINEETHIILGVKFTSYEGRHIIISASGTTISIVQAASNEFSEDADIISSIYDPIGKNIIYVYEDTAIGDTGYYQVFETTIVVSNLPSFNLLGINTTAKTTGQTATVTVLSGINSQQTGLTIDSIYYVDSAGVITKTPNLSFDYKRLGVAVSATEILVDVEEIEEEVTISQSQITDLSINIADLGDELSGIATLPTGDNAINFKAKIHYDKTLDANWSPTITDPVKGKSIVIMATGGAFTLTLPASVKGDVSGFDGTMTNQLTLYCVDDVTPVYSVTLLNW